MQSAQVQLVCLALLLRDGAAKARKIIAEYEPRFASMVEYFAYVDKIDMDVQAVAYEGNKAILTYEEEDE